MFDHRDAEPHQGADLDPSKGASVDATGADARRELLTVEQLRKAVARVDAGSDLSATRSWLAIDLGDVQSTLETLGVRAAQTLSDALADRLRLTMGDRAAIASGPGGGFWLETSISRRPNDVSGAWAAAEAVLAALSKPLRVAGETLTPTPSIGFALRTPGENPDEAAQRAEIALTEARRSGERIAAFDQELRSRTLARREMLVDLRAGMARGEIEPWLQPIVRSGARGRVGPRVNFELLARWRHPDRGLVSPAEFVPLAEESGLIPELGAALIDRAASSIATWAREGLIDYGSINVSMVEFQDPGFAARFVERLQDHRVPDGAVTVEITETSIGEDHGLARRHIRDLSAAGVRVALDDFGTGYSNLRALMEMPIHTVKLDRSLICDVGVDARASELVRAVAQIGRALEFSIVAEGVETERQAQFAETVGCEMLQGFLFAKPMPANAFADWAERRAVAL